MQVVPNYFWSPIEQKQFKITFPLRFLSKTLPFGASEDIFKRSDHNRLVDKIIYILS